MPFVASYSTPIAATVTLSFLKNIDLSGNGYTLNRNTHLRVTGNTAAGALAVTTDGSAGAITVSGLASEVMPIPPSANTVTITISGGGTGVIAFGRDRG